MWQVSAGCGTYQPDVAPISWMWHVSAGCGTYQLDVVRSLGDPFSQTSIKPSLTMLKKTEIVVMVSLVVLAVVIGGTDDDYDEFYGHVDGKLKNTIFHLRKREFEKKKNTSGNSS